MNLKMPELKRALEAFGFTEVKTLLSSGNVVFDSPAKPVAQLERACEKAMNEELGKTFLTIVRPVAELRALIDSDPFAAFRLPAGAKRVVTFVRGKPKGKLELPIERDGAQILVMKDNEVFSAYVVGDKGPVFMTLIEKALGKEVTTRTWETVKKVANA
jgi:uncharacterized protein (DUF1697 family)